MATDHLQIGDISAAQSNKSATANTAHNLLDRAMNQRLDISVGGDITLTVAQQRENAILNLTGTPGSAFNVDMFDANERGTWSTTTSAAGLVGPPPVTGPNAPADANYARQTQDNRSNAQLRSDNLFFVADLGLNPALMLGATIRAQAWMGIAGSDEFGQDGVQAQLKTIDISGNVLQSANTGYISDETLPGGGWPFNDTWFQVGTIDDQSIADPDNPGFPMDIVITNPATEGVQFRFLNDQEAFFNEKNGFDFVELEITGIPPAITCEVVMVSDQSIESFVARQVIT